MVPTASVSGINSSPGGKKRETLRLVILFVCLFFFFQKLIFFLEKFIGLNFILKRFVEKKVCVRSPPKRHSPPPPPPVRLAIWV